jgi:hypothetical protein
VPRRRYCRRWLPVFPAGDGVEMRLDTARRSACATAADGE